MNNMKERARGHGALISILAIVAGLIIWTKFQFFWIIGAGLLVAGIIGAVFTISWRRIYYIWWKLKTDVVKERTYKTLGEVENHEVRGGLFGKRYMLVGGIGKSFFDIEVPKDLYRKIKDEDKVQLTAIECRSYQNGIARTKKRFWVGIKKVEEAGDSNGKRG